MILSYAALYLGALTDAGPAKRGYLQQLTGWQLNDLLFSRSGIVLVMTFNIFPVVYFASRSLLASGTRLAVVARVHGASAGAPSGT